MPELLMLVIVMLGAYLIGAVPFGFLLGKMKGVDIRDHGSGNIGATNVKRVLGSTLGNICFFLDVLKGALPTLIGGVLLGSLGKADPSTSLAWQWIGVAVATVLGHMFPVYLKFKGGKGVATGLGAMLALWPHATIPGLFAFVVWIAVLKCWKMVSVASCAAAISLPLWVSVQRLAGFPDSLVGFEPAVPFVIFTAAIALVVVIKHKSNIKRVLAGTEAKIGQKKNESR